MKCLSNELYICKKCNIIFGSAYDFINDAFDLHATIEKKNCKLTLYYVANA